MEDLEVDKGLSFLDDYVQQAVAAGARPYLRPSERTASVASMSLLHPTSPSSSYRFPPALTNALLSQQQKRQQKGSTMRNMKLLPLIPNPSRHRCFLAPLRRLPLASRAYYFVVGTVSLLTLPFSSFSLKKGPPNLPS